LTFFNKFDVILLLLSISNINFLNPAVLGGGHMSSFKKLINWVKNHSVVLWLIKSVICLMIGAIIFFIFEGLWGNLMLSILCAFLGSFFYLGYQMSFNAAPKGEDAIFKAVKLVLAALMVMVVVGFIISQTAVALISIAAIIYLLILSGIKNIGEVMVRRDSYLN
jgi:hypothetical protein